MADAGNSSWWGEIRDSTVNGLLTSRSPPHDKLPTSPTTIKH